MAVSHEDWLRAVVVLILDQLVVGCERLGAPAAADMSELPVLHDTLAFLVVQRRQFDLLLCR